MVNPQIRDDQLMDVEEALLEMVMFEELEMQRQPKVALRSSIVMLLSVKTFI